MSKRKNFAPSRNDRTSNVPATNIDIELIKIRQPLIIIGMSMYAWESKRVIQIECDESATFHGTKGEYKRNKLMN